MSANVVSNPIVSTPSHRSGIGALFLGFFGTLWLMLGCRGLFGAGWGLLLPALLGGGILFAGWRLTQHDTMAQHSGEAGEERRRARLFRNINIAQWGAIVVLIALLNAVGHVEWITPMIMFIVGIHFIPLAFLFKNQTHWVTGPALALLAALYPFVTAEGPTSPLGPMAAGIILLSGACHMLIKGHRLPTA